MNVEVAGEVVCLHPERAVIWGDRALVADVHLGKGDAFRARGLPLPPGELDDDLARLSSLGVSRLVVLGDLVHGPVSDHTESRVREWRRAFGGEILLVVGNHDRHGVPASWEIDIAPGTPVDGPFTFAHEPQDRPGSFTWAGHVHPTATLRGLADRLRFPAFLVGPTQGILPAFTRFSGGPSFRPNPSWRRFVTTGTVVIELPLGVGG